MSARSRRSLRGAVVLLAVLAISGAASRPAQSFKPTAEFGHVGITKDGMKDITRTSSDGKTLKFSERAVNEVRDADAGVDEIFSSRGEFNDPVAHCDDEMLPECTQRMIDLKNAAISALTGSSPDGAEARRQTGRALHTLQDFYAHSNWIELGNSGANTTLGRGTIPKLGASVHTCGLINTGALTGAGLTSITTGYFTAIIPFGKCAHGIPVVTPGINKDDPSRTGFTAARAAAVAGTTDFVNQVLDASGVAGNDKAIRAYMDVQGTLGFIIDDTGSMGGIIDGVKSVVGNIVNTVATSDHQPDEYLMVRFGDPDVGSAVTSPNASDILAAVNGLVANGGGDCPELSMQGLLNGIQAASEGSTLYLFTDASSKDASLSGNAIAAAQAKDITVNFGLSGSCSPIDPAYITTAQQTGGQLILTAHTAQDTAKLFDLLKPSLSGDLQPLLVSDGTVDAGHTFSVPVDSTVTAATFSVSMDVKGTIQVFRPDGSEVQPTDPGVAITELQNGRIVNVTGPTPGVWKLSITGGSGSYSASVKGNSPIRFDRFDFVETRGRDGHTGLYPILGQPVAGSDLPGRARLFGPASNVHFELRSEAGDVLSPVDLELGGSPDVADDEYYGTLTPPTGSTFRLYATGTDSAGDAFVRAFPPTFRAQSVKVESVSPPAGLPAGQTTPVQFKVTNLGSPGTFGVTSVSSVGSAAPSPSSVTLATGESATVSDAVTIPSGTADGTFVQLSLVAQSTADPAVTNNAVLGLVVGSADTLAPIATATSSPAPNAAGWNRDDVTVHLSAADEAGGSGVKQLQYSATGAGPVAQTTVPGDSADVTVTAEGVTTIAFSATDNAGNTSPEQTVVVRIDRTAPEASIRFDPDTEDLQVVGVDAGSGPVAGPAPFTSIFAVRFYNVLDTAGNKLTVALGEAQDHGQLAAIVLALAYNTADAQRVFLPGGNAIQVEWAKSSKTHALTKLEQRMIVDRPDQDVSASFDSKKNRTTIDQKTPKKHVVLNGVVLLRMTTAAGKLGVAYP
jgi:hypothetical protein